MPLTSPQKLSSVLGYSGSASPTGPYKLSLLQIFFTVPVYLRYTSSAQLPLFDFFFLLLFLFPEIDGQVITQSLPFFQMPLVTLRSNTCLTHWGPGVSKQHSDLAWETHGFFKQCVMCHQSGTGKGKRRVENKLSWNGGRTNTMLTHAFNTQKKLSDSLVIKL